MKCLGQKIVEEILLLSRNNKLSFFFIILLSGCALTATRPKKEMSHAAAAFKAAKLSKAQVISPSLYRKAEFYYLKAKASYRRKYFDKAKQYALLAQKFSEMAEFDANKKETLENLSDN